MRTTKVNRRAGRVSLAPTISLAMPVFNGERYIASAINSILAQSFTDFELIITDNASTDRTREICASFAAADARITYHPNGANVGAAANFNRGLELSSGRYMKWCACDDLISEEFLQRCVGALENDEEATLAYGVAVSINDAGDTIAPLGSVMPEMRASQSSRRFKHALWNVNSCYEVFGVFKRDNLLQSSQHRPYYGSDRALLVEMSMLGTFIFVPDVTFFNREHPGRSINAADKQARGIWQANTRRGRGREHIPLLGDYIGIALRYRSRASLVKTMSTILLWMLQPVQLCRYLLEMIGTVSPTVQSRVRQSGWKMVRMVSGRLNAASK